MWRNLKFLSDYNKVAAEAIDSGWYILGKRVNDFENNKWISTWEGFVWLNEGNFSQTFTTLNSLISSHQTNASVRDKNGIVWITTVAAGLNKFKVMNLE